MSGFSDIPIRQNGKDFLVTAEWWNTIRTKLIVAFGSGGYIAVEPTQQVSNGGQLTYSTESFKPLLQIESDGGAVVASSTPFGTAHGFANGKEIILLGMSDTNVVTFEVNDIDDGIISKGKIVLSKFEQVILIYNSELKRFIRKE